MGQRVRFTENELREAIGKARCWSEALRLLGYRAAGGNHRTVQKYAATWGIAIDHFDGGAVSTAALRRGRIPLSKILIENSSYNRSHLKDRLYQAGLKTPQCELCGQSEKWRGKRMAMILDHINGVWNDNRLENLRIVCPNCAATLQTHCGRKNRGKAQRSLEPRRCLRCGKEFMPKYQKHQYCSRDCGSRSRRTLGIPRVEQRTVERPPFEQLVREVHEMGYLAVGRKYSVSDNAVRKWLRQYKREHAIAEGRDPDVIAIPRRTWPNRKRSREAA